MAQVNDAPESSPSTVIGDEDVAILLDWSAFGVSDEDSAQASLSVQITSLPADGVLEYKDGADWKAVEVGDVFNKVDFDSNSVRFTPDLHESGLAAYNNNGVGNQLNNYAQIGFKPNDGNSEGTDSLLSIDVVPKADQPSVNVSLSGDYIFLHKDYPTYGITTDKFQLGDFDISPIKLGDEINDQKWWQDFVTGSGSDDYYRNVHGGGDFVYTYGGNDVLVGDDSRTGSYLNAGEGNDILVSGLGSDALYGGTGKDIAILPGKSSDYSISKDKLYDPVDDIWFNFETSEDLGFGDESITKALHNIEIVQFEDGIFELDSNTGELIPIPPSHVIVPLTIDVALTDTDGSESITSVQISGLVEGAQLFDSTKTLLGTANAQGIIDLASGWDSKGNQFTVQVPGDKVGQVDLKVTATSTEEANGDSATGSDELSLRDYTLSTGEGGPDVITTSTDNDIVIGDTSGLQIIPGQDYNIAFIFDTSGSMKNTITAAKPELQAAFDKLVESAGADASGEVNVLLTQFDSNASHVISINLDADNPSLEFANKLASIIDDSYGMTNYEAAFNSAIDWFSSLPDNGATNHSFFITDGEINTATENDLGQEQFSDFWMFYDKSSGELESLEDILGNDFELSDLSNGSIKINGVDVVEAHGDKAYVYSPYLDSSNQRVRLGTLRMKYGELVYRDKYDSDEQVTLQAVHMFNVLAGLSAVQAIGIGDGVMESTLKQFDTDKVVDANVDVNKLAEAIAGELVETQPGADEISTLSGDDILFGDEPILFAADSTTELTLQEYVAEKLSMGLGSVDAQTMHEYISSHIDEFGSSSSSDLGDELSGGEGSDILYGQGGDDILVGGEGSDILVGGDGADTFKWVDGDLDSSTDVIKDFDDVEGDKIDLSELFEDDNRTVDEIIASYVTVENSDTNNAEIVVSKGADTVTIELEGWSSADLTDQVLKDILVIKE
ncbi:hypothetical protein TW81_13720 [Vibrio galatheae]|uniref:VWFA domain-containing protein n=1 Tax=Vibrio galatheae TaxID=579748 RepID=A0A0F4NHR7_9VIBR|nr:hypothetical protein TW81_13720 [Vibrio galatheae]